MKKALITGISKGIGRALALKFKGEGFDVYGVGRSDVKIEGVNYKKLDINKSGLDFDTCFDIVILNAGVLGSIQEIGKANVSDLKEVMDTNLWSQKKIIDELIEKKQVTNLIALSSGAAIKGTKGWSGYSLSKAAFKMLIELYADEQKDIKFINLAPGLVNTQMQDYLCDKVDHREFPNIKRLKDARESGSMQSPADFATKFYENIDSILELETGSFIDLRSIE